ncbi:MAG: PAS domain S-box protein, partial [Pseudolabrys sp.]
MLRDFIRLATVISSDGAHAGDGAGLLDAASIELKHHERSFQLLFDRNPIPMWLMDRESLRFVAVNDAAVKHYGYTREKFLTMTAVDVRLPEDRDTFSHYLHSGANSQGRHIWRHQKANGEIILVSVYSGDLTYGGRAARLCAVVDVTERNHAEEKLLEQKNQIDTAMNNMSQGVLMFDSESRLVLCNRRYMEMYNLSPDVVKPGCTLRQLVEHRKAAGLFYEDAEQYCRQLLATVAKGAATSRIVELPDGRTMHAVNHPIAGGGWVATHEDITERKQAQARLAQETNENRRLFETSLDLILVTDRYGNLERVSPISLAILGYAPEEMIGHNAIDFIYPADLERTRGEMRLARTGQHLRNFDTRYVHKDGHIVTLAWSGVWSEPEQRHFFTGRDVTERNVVEEKLKHLAHYDQLTGLPNRVSLHNDLNAAIKSNEGLPASATSIAMFDLDGFKDINDTLGHSTGDRLLQQVARRMTSLINNNGRFYRLSGDEFVLVQPNCGDP